MLDLTRIFLIILKYKTTFDITPRAKIAIVGSLMLSDFRVEG
jgi:hypothetical protein